VTVLTRTRSEEPRARDDKDRYDPSYSVVQSDSNIVYNLFSERE
jgi:hypothetical protein